MPPDSIHQRERALTNAAAAWATMRFNMERAQPGTNHDCWWSVGNALGDIALSIQAAREKETPHA